MFGTSPRLRRPLLLVLVYGAFLALVGITATAQSVMVSAHFSTATLNDVVGSDAATTRAFVNAHLPGRPTSTPPTPSGRSGDATLEEQLATLTRTGEILRVEIRRPDGTVVAASEPGAGGRPRRRRRRVRGRRRAERPGGDRPGRGGGHRARRRGPRRPTTVIREDLPIETGGEVRGVVVMWRDAAPVLARLADVRRDVVLVTLSAALIAAALLFLIFRAAQARLTRQTAELVESTRRDPLTGSLNHGALVAPPRGRDRARQDGRARRSASRSSTSTTSGSSTTTTATTPATRPCSRSTGCSRRDLPDARRRRPLRPGRVPARRAGRRRRRARAGARPAPDGARRPQPPVRGDRAPAGHDQRRRSRRTRSTATSVTVLLAAAARTLQEAKASGGDAVRVAGARTPTAPASRAAFDVLQGLVHAVDTKDRYTKRHSEDVARYGVFLAAAARPRRGAHRDDPDRRACSTTSARSASPTTILRKPGKLTDDEYDDRQAARRARRRDRPRPARRRPRPGRHPPPPRALGRRRLPRPARGRGHPADRPDPRGRRRVLGDDDDAAVPQGARRPGGAAPARGRGRQPARRGPRQRVRRRASRRPRTRRSPGRRRRRPVDAARRVTRPRDRARDRSSDPRRLARLSASRASRSRRASGRSPARRS